MQRCPIAQSLRIAFQQIFVSSQKVVRLFAADYMDAAERLTSALKSVERGEWVTDVSYGWQFLLIPRRACSNYESRR